MVITEEGSHTLEDGTRLYTKTWKPSGTPKARLVLIHGFSDHCNTYTTFCDLLTTHDIEVRSFDQRGWGRSVAHPSHRGATGATALVHADMTSFLTSTCLPSPSPVFLFGHSMGGAQVLTWLADPAVPAGTKAQLRGVLADAPCIALPPASHPSRLTVRAGRIAAWLAPTRQLRRPIDPNALSRDPDVAKAYAEDALCHETGTLAGLAGLLERGRGLDSGEVVLREGLGEGKRTRVWVSHGTEDRVCDVEATKRMVARWGEVDDKELRVYEGWFHRLHDEVGECKAQYAGDVAAWILARAGPLEEGRPGVEPKSKL